MRMGPRLLAMAVVALSAGTMAATQVRDATPAPLATPSGTGGIRGVVMTADAPPQPARRVIVTISGDVAASRSAITDDLGRFAFRNLPAGRFSIQASKAAYLGGGFGALRPGRPGTPISLGSGQQADVTVTIWRGAVVTGIVSDRNGSPMPAVQVAILNARAGTDPAANATEFGVTDDRGVYRIFGVPAGEYVVAALPVPGGTGEMGARSVAEMDALLAELQQRGTRSAGSPGSANSPRPAAPLLAGAPIGFAPTYFPGTPLWRDATRLKLAAGEEKSGVDLQVQPVTAATINGSITGDVPNLAAVRLAIVIGGPRTTTQFASNPVLSMTPNEEGRFRFSNVTPGTYSIVARVARGQTTAATPPMSAVSIGRSGQPPLGASGEFLYAVADVDVLGSPISGVALVLQPGSTFSGRIRFDAGVQPVPDDFTRIRVAVSPPGGTSMSITGDTIIGNTFSAVTPATVEAGGGFTLKSIAPGLYNLQCTLPSEIAPIWWLRSAMVEGRDLLDAPLVFRPGTSYTDVVLTLTDRRTELSGTLQTPTGLPAPEHFVIAFSADRSMWRPGSRRVQAVRPSSDGRFLMRDLPPGDYLLAALLDVEPNEWQDPAFLEQIATAGVPVTIAEGQKKIQDLRIR